MLKGKHLQNNKKKTKKNKKHSTLINELPGGNLRQGGLQLADWLYDPFSQSDDLQYRKYTKSVTEVYI